MRLTQSTPCVGYYYYTVTVLSDCLVTRHGRGHTATYGNTDVPREILVVLYVTAHVTGRNSIL